MSYQSRHAIPTHARRRIIATAVGSTAIAVAGAILPVTASATHNDPNVNVKGGAGCRQAGYLASFVTFALANGENASSPFVALFTNVFNYSVKFHAIPIGGTSGVATVTCTSPSSGASYTWTRTVAVNRPNFGNNVSMSLTAG